MRAFHSFTVRQRVPDALAGLGELSMNLRWSWDERTRDLFRWVDPDAWEVTHHDPVGLLGQVSPDRLEHLAADAAFTTFLREVLDDLRRYLSADRFFQGRDTVLRSIAYFSPEFGIAEALPQYSGGLGVLAGDHLKAASGLGLPVVGVGLFYRQGYFRQELNDDGWQQERYVTLDPHGMAVHPVEGVRVTVDLAGTPLQAQAWRADVGRVRLYLLDADIEANAPDDRLITDRLYGGDTDHRLRQEILLGIGGVRLLEAVGEDTQVFHTNEGHAGFLGLERIRRLITDSGLSFHEAIEAARAGTIFTTHTPVPAGIDRFPRALMERYFRSWADECGVPFDDLMAIGHHPDDEHDAPFNMAVMGLRLAGRSNGVSRLHGQVSRNMFAALWPGVPVDEVPIGSITNGVHARTWVSPEMSDLLDKYVLPEWQEADEDRWARIDECRDDDLWRVREQCRERLVSFVRARMHDDKLLDPRVLTVGFARRFAAYKRATMLLSQPDRLRALLLDPERPIQLVFAGKAHPADDNGKEMIREIVHFSRAGDLRHRFCFVEDYDIAVARTLYQGADVWLNNPRRPQEACGTSGEKAALNGALNLSVRDGWWDEMFDGDNGWAIPSAETDADLARRDFVEASRLFDLLEREVVPLFYERDEGGVPRRWTRRMKHSLRTLGPRVEASRMLRDYVDNMYEPAARHDTLMRAEGCERARSFAAWRQWVTNAWSGVRVDAVDSDHDVADLGAIRRVAATIALADLSPDDVAVELLHGPVGSNDELHATTTIAMGLVVRDHDGRWKYEGSFACDRPGRYGFAVRVVPAHRDLTTFADLGRVTWA
jgi:glycogen phosphorylase